MEQSGTKRRIAMELTYDGVLYHGWQRQNNGLSVQQKVEEVLSERTGRPICVTGCSRTDAGVHALSYVLHFDSDMRIPVEKLADAFNSSHPVGIIAKRAWVADEAFHARYSAIGKTYRYMFWNARTRSPFTEKYSWHIPYSLDIAQMQTACAVFVGKHDFAGFMSAGGSQKTTVRTVRRCELFRDPQWAEQWVMEIEADGFLYNMVRIIAGTLVSVGCGKISVADLPEILASCDRNRAGQTAPPQGLFLKEIYYNANGEGSDDIP
uniref:tRNA pseudouridine synthase A n=1 Tax=uncultured Bacillota bacterium TaxID=344338 RepID=A0A650EME9_9FIRM|nr:tRNA pseudouridine(38-40) synthase TruA [uncultured Firmicutes bacterium]